MRKLALLLVALASIITPGTASTATGTFLALDSQPGDPLGGGVQQTFTRTNATFSARSNGEDTFIDVYAPSSGVWNVEISAPRGGGQLVPGTYTNIARSPFRAWGQPGMDVISPAGGCNTVSGSFTVTEATYGPYLPGIGYLRVIAFDATFEVHCSDAPAALIGEVRYEDPPDLTPPTISPLSDLTTEAEDSTGANVYYSYPYASDSVDPSPQLSCDPPYGARFPVGQTTVTCTATDYSGNVATSAFVVTVLSPTQYVFTIDSKGTVDPKTGVASIGGTITCSRPANFFLGYGDISQTFARRATLTGVLRGGFDIGCSPAPSRWTKTALPPNGKFGAGQAHVEVYFAGACTPYRCAYFANGRDITLSAAKG
jgi:hypothetical protein